MFVLKLEDAKASKPCLRILSMSFVVVSLCEVSIWCGSGNTEHHSYSLFCYTEDARAHTA